MKNYSEFELILHKKVLAKGDIEIITHEAKKKMGELHFSEYGKKKKVFDIANTQKALYGEGRIITMYKYQIKSSIYRCDICNCTFCIKGDNSLICDVCGLGKLVKILDVEVY